MRIGDFHILLKKFCKCQSLSGKFCRTLVSLNQVFIRKPNVTFERHKLLSRRQRDSESLEPFWGALAEMAKNCDISSGRMSAICPSCNLKRHITKNCKSRRKNVYSVYNLELVDTKNVNLSYQPAVKNYVHKNCCGVIICMVVKKTK